MAYIKLRLCERSPIAAALAIHWRKGSSNGAYSGFLVRASPRASSTVGLKAARLELQNSTSTHGHYRSRLRHPLRVVPDANLGSDAKA